MSIYLCMQKQQAKFYLYYLHTRKSTAHWWVIIIQLDNSMSKSLITIYYLSFISCFKKQIKWWVTSVTLDVKHIH